MQLYYSPGACSLADHIALLEANLAFDLQRVDLKTKRLEDGRDFREINPKGYVPALGLDSGELLSENIAILDWIASQHQALYPAGELGRTRMLEAMAFISSEVHKAFAPMFAAAGESTEAEQARARDRIAAKLDFIAASFKGPFLFGPSLSAADAYLFVMIMWAERNSIAIPGVLREFARTMRVRPTVQTALRREGVA